MEVAAGKFIMFHEIKLSFKEDMCVSAHHVSEGTEWNGGRQGENETNGLN